MQVFHGNTHPAQHLHDAQRDVQAGSDSDQFEMPRDRRALDERGGFTRVGVVRKASRGRYGGQSGTRATCTRETAEKSRFSEPVYYVFDNREPKTPPPNPLP